jgi:alpha-acetolactate decarboxylase
LLSLLTLVVVLDFSCQSYENKLIGTWVPASKRGIQNSGYEISFFADHRVTSFGPSGKEKSRDSVTYELLDGSKRIRFKTRFGETKEVIVLELNDSNLIFHPADETKDTIRYIRQQ